MRHWMGSAMVQIMACWLFHSAQNHYLSQCWVIVNWTFWNKLQWNFCQNTKKCQSRKCIWKYPGGDELSQLSLAARQCILTWNFQGMLAHRGPTFIPTTHQNVTNKTRAQHPLPRPRSVYKGSVERRFLEFWSKWPNDLEGQDQWPPFSIPAERIPRCIFGEWKFDVCSSDLLYVIVQTCQIVNQNNHNDLEGQDQWPLFSIAVESISGCMFGVNLVIPAHICDELSCGKGKVYGWTDKWSDRQTDAQIDRRRQGRYPFGPSAN